MILFTMLLFFTRLMDGPIELMVAPFELMDDLKKYLNQQ